MNLGHTRHRRLITASFAALALASCGSSEATPPAIETPSAETPAAPTEPEAAPSEAPRVHAPEALPSERMGTVSEGDGLELGVPAPDAHVQTITGEATTLAQLYAAGPTMVVFYRGGWCPFCNFQVHELAENHPAFVERGVQLVMISVDRPEESARTSAAYEIPFTVLSDSDLEAHTAYHVLHVVDAETLERYDGMGLDLAGASGRDHHTIAIPSVYVVRDGNVIFRHVDRDYRTRPSAAQLLEVLDGLAVPARE